jgi:hypothetical protein
LQTAEEMRRDAEAIEEAKCEVRGPRFIDLARSGDSHHEEQGRRLENAHPKVSIPELRLALRRELLHRERRKLEERLKEEGL